MKGIKTMGLATAMALALIAFVGAASASAAIFEVPGSGESTTKWNGVGVEKNHTLKLGGFNSFTSCSGVPFSGEMKGESASELTVSPSSSQFNCAWLGLSVHWNTGTCDFRLNPGAEPGNPVVGTLDIVGCETPMTFKAIGCELSIGNQNNIGKVTYTRSESEGVQSVNVAANLSGITYTRVSEGGGCNGGKSGTFSDGTYTGEWTVRPAHFAVEKTPATITGTRINSKALVFPTANVGVSCKKFESSGSMGTLISEGITLDTVLFGECTAFGGAQSVSMGNCSFRYTGSGGVQILGANCANQPITIKDSAPGYECTVSVGPQGPRSASGQSLKNEGSGSERTVTMNGTGPPLGGFEYTAVGAGCSHAGTFTDGEYKLYLKFTAKSPFGSQGLWIE